MTDSPTRHATASTDDAQAFERHVVTGVPARPPHVRSITSQQLFATYPEVQITHGDTVYRLRQTSLGKLILTK
jgi:hemin uptake protein HemP